MLGQRDSPVFDANVINGRTEDGPREVVKFDRSYAVGDDELNDEVRRADIESHRDCSRAGTVPSDRTSEHLIDGETHVLHVVDREPGVGGQRRCDQPYCGGSVETGGHA
jgi:hypothetical protein